MSHPLMKELTMLRRMRIDIAFLQYLVGLEDHHNIGDLKYLLERLRQKGLLQEILREHYDYQGL